MKKFLLLGPNGQLGTDICRMAMDSGLCEIVPVTRDVVDMENRTEIESALNGLAFDGIINCTTYHKTDECEEYPEKAFAVNASSVAELAKYCKKGRKLLVHISTDYVFGGTENRPLTEEDKTQPLNVYGISKVAGENFIQAYHDLYYVFRVSSLFGVAGASGKGGNFVETMLHMAGEGKPLKVVNDQWMSPTHTLDIARAIMAVVVPETAPYGIYHCSGEGACSWYDFAKEIFRQAGIHADLSPVSSEDFPTKARRPAYSVLSNAKLSPFYQMNDWQVALREYLLLKGHIH